MNIMNEQFLPLTSLDDQKTKGPPDVRGGDNDPLVGSAREPMLNQR